MRGSQSASPAGSRSGGTISRSAYICEDHRDELEIDEVKRHVDAEQLPALAFPRDRAELHRHVESEPGEKAGEEPVHVPGGVGARAPYRGAPDVRRIREHPGGQERPDHHQHHSAHHDFRVGLHVGRKLHQARPFLAEQRPVPQPAEEKAGHDGDGDRNPVHVDLWMHGSSFTGERQWRASYSCPPDRVSPGNLTEGWRRAPKRVKLARHSTHDRRSILAHLTHVTHSQMLETLRRRKRGKKDLAGMAKRAKKAKRQNAQKAGAAAPKSPLAAQSSDTPSSL